MKTLKQLLIVTGVLIFASGLGFAQRKPHGGAKGGAHDRNFHFGLTDSCWRVFLGDLPADTATKLTGAIGGAKDIEAQIDTAEKELREAREDKDSAKVDSLKNLVIALREEKLGDLFTIRSILIEYQGTLREVRKTCDTTHRGGGTIGLKVTPIVPNPATTQAHFSYTINADEHVLITISDQLGTLTKVIFEGDVSKGEHDVKMDLSGFRAGMYLVRIQAGPDVNTLKLMISGSSTN